MWLQVFLSIGMRLLRFVALPVFGLTIVLIGYSALGAHRVESENPPVGKFLKIDGIRLHYVDKGKGVPIVLIHGASSTLREFTSSILPILAKSHRVIAFDRPGFGYSERPVGYWPDPAYQAKIIRIALQRLQVQNPVLLGHSWGGAVVLAFLLDNPCQAAGAVLLAGVSHPWPGGVYWAYDIVQIPLLGRLFAEALVYPLGQLLLDNVAAEVFAPKPVKPGHLERTGAMLALRGKSFLANAEDVSRLSDYLGEQSRKYGQITAPLLLITDRRDTIVPPENHAHRLVRDVPHAELVLLENTGHAPHHTHMDEISSLVDAFVVKIHHGTDERATP